MKHFCEIFSLQGVKEASIIFTNHSQQGWHAVYDQRCIKFRRKNKYRFSIPPWSTQNEFERQDSQNCARWCRNKVFVGVICLLSLTVNCQLVRDFLDRIIRLVHIFL